MNPIQVVRKSDGAASKVQSGHVVLDQPATVKLGIDPQSVERAERVGNDLHLVLKDGTSIDIDGFFAAGANGQSSDLLMQDASGTVWHGEPTQPWAGFHFTELPAEAAPAAAAAAGSGGMSTLAMTLLGVAGAGALAAAAGGGGGGGGSSPAPTSPPPPPPPPPPPTPTVAITSFGHTALPAGSDAGTPVTLHGTSNGQYVTVAWQQPDGTHGNSGVIRVSSDGSWTLEIPRDQLHNGQAQFVATITDSAGQPVLLNGLAVSYGANADIEQPNHAPTLDTHTVHLGEDASATGVLIAHDADGDRLTFAVTTPPSSGTLVVDATTGAYTYTPNTDFFGGDNFVITVQDGRGGSTSGNFLVNVEAVNDAPKIGDYHFFDMEDLSLGESIRAEDTELDSLTYTVTGAPTHGTVTMAAATGFFIYKPATDFHGIDEFRVTVNDGHGGTTYSTVTIEVYAVNDAPTADDQHFATVEDTPLSGMILASDVDGDALDFSVYTPPAHGTVTLDSANGSFVYTPAADFHGSDQFTVYLHDQNGGATPATVYIDVAPVNDAPVAHADGIRVMEGGTASTLSDGTTSLLANDTDADGNALTAVLVQGPYNGTVTLNADGTFVYVHNGSEDFGDTFTYTVNDGTTNGNVETVWINVVPVNDVPVAVDDHLTVENGGTQTFLDGWRSSVVQNDVDPDFMAWLRASLVTGPAHGTLTFNQDGSFVYVHDGSATTSDSFTYRANDGTAESNLATVTITIEPLNLGPVATTDYATTTDGMPVDIDILANDYDPDGDPLSIIAFDQIYAGSLSFDPATQIATFTPTPGFVGIASFSYFLDDNHGHGMVGNVEITVGAGPSPTAVVPEAITAIDFDALQGTDARLAPGAAAPALPALHEVLSEHPVAVASDALSAWLSSAGTPGTIAAPTGASLPSTDLHFSTLPNPLHELDPAHHLVQA